MAKGKSHICLKIVNALRIGGGVVQADDFEQLKDKLDCKDESMTQFRRALSTLAMSPRFQDPETERQRVTVIRNGADRRSGGMQVTRPVMVRLNQAA